MGLRRFCRFTQDEKHIRRRESLEKIGAMVAIVPAGQPAAKPIQSRPERGVVGVNPAPVAEMAKRWKFKISPTQDFKAGLRHDFFQQLAGEAAFAGSQSGLARQRPRAKRGDGFLDEADAAGLEPRGKVRVRRGRGWGYGAARRC